MIGGEKLCCSQDTTNSAGKFHRKCRCCGKLCDIQQGEINESHAGNDVTNVTETLTVDICTSYVEPIHENYFYKSRSKWIIMQVYKLINLDSSTL